MATEGTWQEHLALLYSLDHWWGYLVRLATLVIAAIVVTQIGKLFVRHFFRYALRGHRVMVSERRARTLESLLSSLVTFTVIIIVVVWALLLLGAPSGALLPALGLFSAGFGLGARPLVSDYLAGITLLFEYSYAFGEKVEILDVMGTVEHVGLRTTEIRADTGELFVVPNGDVRVIRNFSRGAFSPASVRITVAPTNLLAAAEVLERFAQTALDRYGDELVGPPEVVSASGELSAKTELTFVARAQFARGAQLRLKLMEDIHKALQAAGIEETG